MPQPHQWAYSERRPLVFPDLSRLTSLYMGWTFTKGRPPYVHIDTSSTQLSWRWAVCSRMALSTEELFLRVLAQTTQRSKMRRTIQDDCKSLLKSSVQKMLVDDLLRDQNMRLSLQYPLLELKLAGLACKTRKAGFFAEETRSIDVILKTEWALEPPDRGPMAPGGGLGPPGFGGPAYGPGGPPYGPGGGGWDFNNNRDPRALGGDTVRPGHPNARPTTQTQPGIPHVQSQAAPVRPVSATSSREPRLVFVREGGKGKTIRPIEESSHRVFLWDERGGSKVYAENRRPASVRRSKVHDGFRASAAPAASASGLPPPPPPGGMYGTFPYAWSQPLMGGTSAYVQPQPPPPEPVYFAGSGFPPRPTNDNVQVLARDMTVEQERQIIDELFAEWEDGVHNKGEKLNAETQAYKKEEQRPSTYKQNAVVRMGTTRRLMMEVEREAQKKETLEKKLRHAHTLEPGYSFANEPGDRRRTAYATRPRRRRRPVSINLRGSQEGDSDIEREAYFEDFYRRYDRYPDGTVPEQSERRREERRRDYFQTPMRGHHVNLSEPSGRHDSTRAVASEVPSEMMERERARRPPHSHVVITTRPERTARGRDMRIVETRSPRLRVYTSDSESWAEVEEATIYSSDD
ncbi:uncharacterized protein N7482_009392 [Penicillium canariense]|uniref:Uncharacterized protein n=1 Tax=Penicillium canariense TaxID=189055 RepID=A0A9W9HQ98_9EURO|nr:uncharacterized protein N7482_009392 [Penicillium canariense]KAJ5152914.1 hypothetical protein N7482_009392 [Penicillium canariense]